MIVYVYRPKAKAMDMIHIMQEHETLMKDHRAISQVTRLTSGRRLFASWDICIYVCMHIHIYI